MHKTYTLLLITYCLIHSVLADNFLMKKIYNLWWYRFFYVVFSVLSLIPISYVYIKIPKELSFYPQSNSLYFIGLAGLIFGIYATRSYDNLSFLGIKQLKNYILHKEKIEDNKQLNFDGALKIVRHPYYLAGILILWGRPLYIKDLILNIVFTTYFIIGALNEERKLVRIFGGDYLKYKSKVPMFIPRIFKK